MAILAVARLREIQLSQQALKRNEEGGKGSEGKGLSLCYTK
jgi:hypothetical protein